MVHVAIVGAGFAGLRCADILTRQKGVKVTIYEARDRIGGRVLQYTAGERTFDMGPNWIHGSGGNPMMDLAEKTGTILMEPEERQIIFDSNGNKKSAEEATELATDTWASIVNAFKHSNEHCTEIDPRVSLLDFFRERLTQRFPNDEKEVRERVNEARMWGPFVGDPIDRQSLRNFFLEECLDGDNLIVASNYGKILSEVARRAQETAIWRFNQEVTRIEYRGLDDKTNVLLTTAQGEQDMYDEVVVTCPLGWLKRHKEDAFSPSLPPRLSQAISNIGYGNLEKIYVTFPSAWWLHDASTSTETNAPDDLNATTPPTETTPLFIHFHHPTYHPNPHSKLNEYWNQSIVSMANFPGPTAQPTLLFYMYGPCSLYMTSMIASHEPGSGKYNSLLSDFLRPFIERLPFYSADNLACVPVSFVATQWSNDPHAGYGSYSNFQVGLDRGDKDIKCMREAGGLSEAGKGLWFAGEHTAPFVAIGTTTGAYWSGEAVANKILHRYGVEDVQIGDDEVNGVVGEGAKKEMNGEVKDGANLAGLAI